MAQATVSSHAIKLAQMLSSINVYAQACGSEMCQAVY